LHCGNGLEGWKFLAFKARTISPTDAMLHCSKWGWPAGAAAHK
jgi:hypothetical protein